MISHKVISVGSKNNNKQTFHFLTVSPSVNISTSTKQIKSALSKAPSSTQLWNYKQKSVSTFFKGIFKV